MVEKPPKLMRKLHIIVAQSVDSKLASMQPLVISISPSKSGTTAGGRREKTGESDSIIIKNRQIIPPTHKTLCTLDNMMSPKEEVSL